MIVESPAVTLDHRLIARGLSLLGKVLFFVGMSVATAGPVDANAAWIAVPVLAGLIMIAMSFIAMIQRSPRAGAIEVRDGAVTIRTGDTVRSVSAKKIAAAYVVMRPHHGVSTPGVEIVTRMGSHARIVMPDEATAQAIIETMGFGPEGRALRIDLARPARRWLHPLVGMLSIVIGFFVGAFTAGIFAATREDGAPIVTPMALWCYVCMGLVYALLKRYFAAPIVTVGSDGLALRRRLETHRVPRWDVTGIGRPRPGGAVVVGRRRGEAVSIDGVLVDHALLDTVVAETERRLRVVEIHPRASAFERGSRDVKSWKAGLRVALDGGYRASTASVDDAAAVLASPGSSTEQRLGAALALRIAGEPPERIRVAAEGVVDPKLRVAFETVADADDDEKLEKVLRKLSP